MSLLVVSPASRRAVQNERQGKQEGERARTAFSGQRLNPHFRLGFRFMKAETHGPNNGQLQPRAQSGHKVLTCTERVFLACQGPAQPAQEIRLLNYYLPLVQNRTRALTASFTSFWNAGRDQFKRRKKEKKKKKREGERERVTESKLFLLCQQLSPRAYWARTPQDILPRDKQLCQRTRRGKKRKEKNFGTYST
jgi:hypothetical protein